jgi:hypothetical protein
VAKIFWRDVGVALLAGLAVHTGALAQAEGPPLGPWYARYLAQGRSDVEIHLGSAGTSISARVRMQADGTALCQVSGLRRASAGVLVHEVTHCLVGPYIAALRSDNEGPAGELADRLVQLSSESISDARAVIEVFRADGAEAAQDLVAAMLPQRIRSASASHTTAAALEAALRLTQQSPESLSKPSQAFAAAIAVGSEGARQTLAGEPGTAELLQSAAMRETGRSLAAALARAHQAFEAGRYRNNAVTLHASNETMSPSDRHLFVDDDGVIVEKPTISAEGAHHLDALQDLMSASPSPEHRLAVQWLLRQGKLEIESLPRVRGIFGRFLRSVGDGSAASVERIAQVLESAISVGPRGLDLSALLDETSDRVRSTQPSG